jgi:hypothetical protein
LRQRPAKHLAAIGDDMGTRQFQKGCTPMCAVTVAEP